MNKDFDPPATATGWRKAVVSDNWEDPCGAAGVLDQTRKLSSLLEHRVLLFLFEIRWKQTG